MVMSIYYRLSTTDDREERIEDDEMRDALMRAWPDRLVILKSEDKFPEDGLALGRRKRNEICKASHLAYWQDAGFQSGISRSFSLCDLSGAKERIQSLHDLGKDVFLKATESKLMVAKVAQGETIYDAIGDLIYSFVDKPDCLLVQEFIEMRNEHRFIVMDGEIVTHSPVQTDLTPRVREEMVDIFQGGKVSGSQIGDLHYPTPSSDSVPRHDPDLTQEMIECVQGVIEKSDYLDVVVDVCETLDGRIEVIEFNPMIPGAVGLFGCDPDAIANACDKLAPRARNFHVKSRKSLIVDLVQSQAEDEEPFLDV